MQATLLIILFAVSNLCLTHGTYMFPDVFLLTLFSSRWLAPLSVNREEYHGRLASRVNSKAWPFSGRCPTGRPPDRIYSKTPARPTLQGPRTVQDQEPVACRWRQPKRSNGCRPFLAMQFPPVLPCAHYTRAVIHNPQAMSNGHLLQLGRARKAFVHHALAKTAQRILNRGR
jgi:hypothetical protein